MVTLVNVWRFAARVVIWHTLHRTYVNCFERQIPCPADAGGTERRRWDAAARIEEVRWLKRQPSLVRPIREKEPKSVAQ